MDSTKRPAESPRDDVIVGRNAVMEALKSDRTVDLIYVSQSANGGSIGKILAIAKERRIVVKTVAPQKLDAMAKGVVHQGVAAVMSVADYADLHDVIRSVRERGEKLFLIICDEIEDPHNLGAILRTAEAAGAHGVIIPKRRSATLTQTVYKTSAGAASVVPVCRVSNLRQTVVALKKEGVWVYAADMDGTPWCQQDYLLDTALIIGSEGRGVNRILREEVDQIISMPMNGQINSLNASVAAGIMMYEVARQRQQIKVKN